MSIILLINHLLADHRNPDFRDNTFFGDPIFLVLITKPFSNHPSMIVVLVSPSWLPFFLSG
jgi:hypothetical protein